jgi:oxygen-independent coproporphyrinogen-3 oxidase
MAGIYFHIPFCRQACHYCNFHFSTSMKLKTPVLDAMLKELELRHHYLEDKTLSSVYLGGGTPSLLNKEELHQLFVKIEQYFTLAGDAEITLEANPDDLNEEQLNMLADSPVNRLSIGIQSFFEQDLQFMNRAHNAVEARQCIENALDKGFNDLTIDLIYGAPTTSDENWAKNLAIAFEYDVPHLSCYALTVEENTALHHFVQAGKAPPVEEEKAARQFEYLMKVAKQEGYLHYEISNFARPGRLAVHNSNYWKGAHYLGIGPSAHSFNGSSRSWNIANNALYVKALSTDPPASFYEREILSPADQYNEYIMTGLRTIWGVMLPQIANIHTAYKGHFLQNCRPFLEDGSMIQQGEKFYLSEQGRLLADGIAASLFV